MNAIRVCATVAAIACTSGWLTADAPPGPRPGQVSPSLVGAGTISTVDYESGGSKAPDGELFFAKRPAVPYYWVICTAAPSPAGWSEPQVASFSGRFSDRDPFVAPTGARLFFASNRTPDQTSRKRDFDIWVVDRLTTGWSQPRPLAINTEHDELHPSVDHAGHLYFASNRAGSRGLDVYRAAFTNGAYSAPERLSINSDGVDTDPAIAPDGRTLVFASVGRPDEPLPSGVPYPRGDLYLAALRATGWAAPKRLPAVVNTVAAELAPAFTPDGRTLMFTSERNFAMIPNSRRRAYLDFRDGLRSIENGLGNIYEIAVTALEGSR